MIHESTFAIRTYHTDAFGHVNNSRYLELLEEARWQFSEDIGLTPLLRKLSLGFIIVEMQAKFRLPVFEGDTISILTSLEILGSSSGEVRQIVTRGEDSRIALKSLFHFILISRENARSVPIAGEIRDLLLDIIETPR